MFYTDRLMLRNFDERADLNVMLQWLNDADFMRALTLDAQKPASREKAREFLQARMKNEGGRPCFVVCEKPSPDQLPDTLKVEDDLFMRDSKPRYPMIGILNIRHPSMSITNRVTGLGIALDKEHQGMRAIPPSTSSSSRLLLTNGTRSRLRHRALELGLRLHFQPSRFPSLRARSRSRQYPGAQVLRESRVCDRRTTTRILLPEREVEGSRAHGDAGVGVVGEAGEGIW